MNRIKYTIDELNDYPIERHEFEARTQHSPIYYRKNTSGEICQFAICPACNGPAQIIGLYKKLANTDKPYGKHVNYSLNNLAPYIQENYNYCPFRAQKETYNKRTKKKDDGGLSRLIIQKLVLKFDKIVYFISKFIGIYISENLAKTMLDDYFSSKAYLYPGSTLINLPLMLVYFMRSQTLFGRILKDNEDLERALMPVIQVSLKNKKVIKIGNDSQSLKFYCLQHQAILVDQALTEIVWFEVVLEKSTIFRKKLTFDPTYAENLMNYSYTTNNAKINERNKTLLEIARSVAKKYGFIFD